MKRSILIPVVTFAIFSLILVFAGREFPKYAIRMFGFLPVLLLDFAYWKPFRESIKKIPRQCKGSLSVLYWLPMVSVTVLLLAASVLPERIIPGFAAIYAPGIVIALMAGKIIQLVFMILATILNLVFQLLSVILKTWRSSGFRTLLLRIMTLAGTALSLLVMVVMFSGMIFRVYDFKILTIPVKVSNLPESFDGYRIVQISDIHLGSWYSMKPLEKAVEEINSLHPDLVVFTGDMVNFSSSEVLNAKGILSKISAKDGVFTILGNHDYGDYRTWMSDAEKEKNNRELEEFYQKLGWILLKNDLRVIHKGEDSITILGVENWSANKIWGRRGDLARALSGTSRVSFKILLSHDPTHWNAEVTKKHDDIALTLSGHTHAMQMGWEMRNCRWSPSQWIFREWAGLYRYQTKSGTTQYLYVNRGLGNLGYPGRLGIRPEITLLILDSQQQAAK